MGTNRFRVKGPNACCFKISNSLKLQKSEMSSTHYFLCTENHKALNI